MKLELGDPAPRFRLLPIQMVSTEQGVILRRGVDRLRVSGQAAQDVLEQIFDATGRDGGATVDDIYSRFHDDLRAPVQDIVNRLITRRILVEIQDDHRVGSTEQGSDESSAEVFYWQFGTNPARIADNLAATRVSIAGVNLVSQRMAESLQTNGFPNVTVIDHPLLRNVRLFDPGGRLAARHWRADLPQPIDYEDWVREEAPVDCLVVTSDFGGMQLLREWNEFAVRFNLHFLPVMLQDMVGYIGPLVMPRETPCFECLWARQNSHLADPRSQRAAESAAFYGQLVNGFLPPMASVLGDLAAMELIKFYSRGLPGGGVGNLIEVDLTQPSLKTRKVLKVPRCSVCGPLTAHSNKAVDNTVFMPGNDLE